MAMFIVKDLTYLKKGGRIGKVAGTIGSLLKICPIVRVNDDGVYESSTKSLGFSRSRKPKTFPDVHFVFSSLLPQGHRLEKKR